MEEVVRTIVFWVQIIVPLSILGIIACALFLASIGLGTIQEEILRRDIERQREERQTNGEGQEGEIGSGLLA